MKKQTKSQLLKDFYKGYHTWLENGAKIEDETFSRELGLCANLRTYCHNRGNDGIAVIEVIQCKKEMVNQFGEAGLDSDYPFNNGDGDLYNKESEKGLLYLNPNRIQWVKDHL